MSALALRGGQPVRTDSYPSWPVFDERDVEAVSAAVRSGRWGGSPYPGPYQIAFGQRFSAMQGGGHPVMMMNGTITMEVALRAAGIGWGDEVIVPAYTFQATAYAPMAAGAIPVIVDIDADGQIVKVLHPDYRQELGPALYLQLIEAWAKEHGRPEWAL